MTTTLALPIATPRGIDTNPYVGYSYSYPHKSAYGPLVPAMPLAQLWSDEKKDALFLYIHIPFCEVRCGFCNLFARAGGEDALVESYLDALERQAHAVSNSITGERSFSRLALGGGTPTFLSPTQLDRVFDIADRYFDAPANRLPTSVEVSPATATADRVRCLMEHSVERVSIGIQSFAREENQAIGRPQKESDVLAALDRLRAFPLLNIDLIYGQPSQSLSSWLASLRLAVEFQADELYLYPLYVRPETGIGRRHRASAPEAHMRTLYRAGRDFLLGTGYEQVSMRFFRKPESPGTARPHYCCQTDGMIGLGCGARSYTSHGHYASRFAVDAPAVEGIIDEWTRQSDADFARADWGCLLSEDDRRRRYVIQSLLTLPGLALADYECRYGKMPADIMLHIADLQRAGFIEQVADTVRLTSLGLEYSDAIGPSLYAPARLTRFEAFAQS